MRIRSRRFGTWVRLGALATLAYACGPAGSSNEIASTKQRLVDHPMNIESDLVDRNGFMLDPAWRVQRLGDPSPPDPGMCGGLLVVNGVPPVGNPPCTDQPLELNLADVTIGIPGAAECQAERYGGGNVPSPFGLNGHMNWSGAVTLRGTLAFEGREDEPPLGDDDINFLITRPDNHLALAGNPYVKAEFNSDETVDSYPTPLWTELTSNNNHLLDGHQGIVTGLPGIDGVHSPEHMELHPAWAFSGQVGTDGIGSAACKGIGVNRFVGAKCTIDHWMTFVRSEGNEGDCSSHPEDLSIANDGAGTDGHGFKIEYPWNGPAGASVKSVRNEYPSAISRVDPIQDQAVIGTFAFTSPGHGPPSNVAADLAFVYGSARIFGLDRMISSDGGFLGLRLVEDPLPRFVPQEEFVKGDFNGDGLPDTAHVFREDDGNTSVEVYVNNGDGTLATHQTWASHQWGWVEHGGTLVGDFDADGRDDLLYVFLDDTGDFNQISIDFHRSDPHGFDGRDGFLAQARWTPEHGIGYWFDQQGIAVGDFDGDRRPDLAHYFRDDSADPAQLSIDVYVNNPTGNNGSPGFSGPNRWLDKGGAWVDSNIVIPADFSGDGRLDMAYVFKADSVVDVEMFTFSPTAILGGPGFQDSGRWINDIAFVEHDAFIVADFTSDGRPDLAHLFPTDDTGPQTISLDVHEFDATVNNGGPGFGGPERWLNMHGDWNEKIWTHGDFNNDCAPDLLHFLNTDGSVSQDIRPNLFVPTVKTVDFAYVPPDMTVTTCDHPDIGLARPAACNPNLTVTSNKPAIFKPGLNSVVWTVTDSNTHESKQVTQLVTVVPGNDPACHPQVIAHGPDAYHACRVLTDGSVKCWGNNNNGQLGLGDTVNHGATPGPIPTVDLGGKAARSLALGQVHTCALFDDGTVKCWGDNSRGQLGQNTATAVGKTSASEVANLPPIDLGSGRHAVSIAAGGWNSCAILDNGTLKCWGNAAHFELGNNVNTNNLGDGFNAAGTPVNEMGDNLPIVNVGQGRTVRQVAVGTLHVCALLDNGVVKCWGQNQFGQDGLGNAAQQTYQRTPGGGVVFAPGDVVVDITAGGYHTCALLATSSVKCWGRNTWGNLGIDSFVNQGYGPNSLGINMNAVLLNGASAIAITAGLSNTCALLSTGDVRCWGVGGYGEDGLYNEAAFGADTYAGDVLGEMSSLITAPPIPLGSGLTTTSIACGGYSACAILSNGSEKCWGYNNYGQLGIGTHIDRGLNASTMGDALPAVGL